MPINQRLSEQLFNCSDNYARLHRHLAPQTSDPHPTLASLGPPRRARLAHRALSALRQTRLPLRHRARPRTQILPVGQLSQWPTSTAIPAANPARPSANPLKKLSTCARSVGTDMRPQPRTLAPSAKGLKDGIGGGLADQSWAGGSSRRHHAPSLPPGWRARLSSCPVGLCL